MADALCAQVDPDEWTEIRPGGSSRLPKRICSRCPVQAACTAHINRIEDAEGTQPGLWGGASKQQRTKARRRLEEAA
ncbi:WhiB family transcriptional regulator [Streptomyces sp. NPDC006872]|uniref:WhiB family transcriptional regulator n=1 Tax=Streptomyces sp. NPDC006872 TaxID=3155720 RepID=UPI0033D01D1B